MIECAVTALLLSQYTSNSSRNSDLISPDKVFSKISTTFFRQSKTMAPGKSSSRTKFSFLVKQISPSLSICGAKPNCLLESKNMGSWEGKLEGRPTTNVVGPSITSS